MISPFADIKNIEAVTDSIQSISKSDDGKIFTNSGAANRVNLTLPTPQKGLVFGFLVLDAVGIKISGQPGTEAFVGDTMISYTVGAFIELMGVSDTQWSISRNEGWFLPDTNQYGQVSDSSFLEKNSDNVYSCGLNALGVLGDNTATDKSSPVPIVGGHKFKAISRSTHTAVAIDTDGFAWAWGEGASGQLGEDSGVAGSSPVSVVGDHKFVMVSTTFDTSSTGACAAIDENGYAWAWGANGKGQLGDNTVNSRSSPVSVVGGKKFKSIHCGSDCIIALDLNGFAWTWGNNAQGELGIGTFGTATNESSPVSVIGGHVFTSIAGGTLYSSAIDKDGFAWSWGYNGNGRLGDNTTVNRSSPVSVVGGLRFVDISSGNATSAIDENGFAWSWGFGTTGRLGNNDVANQSSPVSVVGGIKFVGISVGDSHACALAETGHIYGWGNNLNGQLGDNTTTDQSSPVSIVRLAILPAGVKIGKTRF